MATRSQKRRRVSYKAEKKAAKRSDQRHDKTEVKKALLNEGKTKQRTAAIWQTLRNGEKIEIDTSFETLPLYIREGIPEIKVDYHVPQCSLPASALDTPKYVRPSDRLVEMSSKEDKLDDKPVHSCYKTGFTCSGVLKFGLLAMSAGLGGYVIYKVCTRK